ncbi:MAG: patatin-like phospholipase family protein [Williamsia sp.]|nr:patatin-like phospholipase family protein [Williamsia sp.]
MKRALVISGGGARGAFAVGVIRYLSSHFPSIVFDSIIGTSTGALIAPMAAIGDINTLVKLYTTTTTNNIILKGNIVNRLLSSNSLYDASPLAQLISQYYNDAYCQKLFQLQKEIYLVTTCLQTSDTVYFTNRDAQLQTDFDVRKLLNPDELRRAMMASACQPVFMPPIEVKKGSVPLRQYVDGGVRELAGLQLAIDAGAEEIFAILLTPANAPAEEKNFNNTLSILEQTVDIFTQDVGLNDVQLPLAYNRALGYIAAVKNKMLAAGIPPQTIDNYFTVPDNPFSGKKPLKIWIIRPDTALGGGPGGLNFDPAEMKAMLAKGEQKAADFMAHLPPQGSV